MTVNILELNIEVVHRSAYRDLLTEELKITEQKTVWGVFDVSVSIQCGPGETVEDFGELGDVEIPEYDPYEDGNVDGSCPKSPPEELEPTPDAAPDHYSKASVLLS